MTANSESLYQEIILDHYRHPQHRGLTDPYDCEVHHLNPTCGDEITLRLRLDGETIADLSWEGEGCSISQASTSIMSDLVIGRNVLSALDLQHEFLELMQSRGNAELDDAAEERLDDAIAFAGVAKYPARVKCALLGWMAMKSALAQMPGGQSLHPTGSSRASSSAARDSTTPDSTAPDSTVSDTKESIT